MIANSTARGGFATAIGYATSEESGRVDEYDEDQARRYGLLNEDGEVERVGAIKTRNLFHDDLDKIKAEMRVTARSRRQLEKPVYHVSISYHEDEEISEAEMIDDAEEFLERRGLGEHQSVIAVHRDTNHPHVHIVANRAHPSGEKSWDTSFEQMKNMDVLRELEQERGRISPKDHRRDPEGPKLPSWKQKNLRKEILKNGIENTDKPFALQVQDVAGDDFANAESWEELQQGLAEKGLQVKRKGRGGIVTDGEQEGQLSSVSQKWSFSKLDNRFADSFHQIDQRNGRNGRSAADGRRQPRERRDRTAHQADSESNAGGKGAEEGERPGEAGAGGSPDGFGGAEEGEQGHPRETDADEEYSEDLRAGSEHLSEPSGQGDEVQGGVQERDGVSGERNRELGEREGGREASSEELQEGSGTVSGVGGVDGPDATHSTGDRDSRRRRHGSDRKDVSRVDENLEADAGGDPEDRPIEADSERTQSHESQRVRAVPDSLQESTWALREAPEMTRSEELEGWEWKVHDHLEGGRNAEAARVFQNADEEEQTDLVEKLDEYDRNDLRRGFEKLAGLDQPGQDSEDSGPTSPGEDEGQDQGEDEGRSRGSRGYDRGRGMGF